MAIFIPWFDTEEYRLEAYPEDMELTQEEEDLKENFGLDKAQLFWRRLKIAEIGPNKFKQEYPTTPEEAFLTSGNYVFSQEKLESLIPSKPKLRSRYNEETRYFDQDPHGELEVWIPPNFKDSYVIGADVSQGVDRDFSTAIVMNREGEVCALWRSNKTDPSTFADTLHDLGRHYNNALLAVESNSIGLATLNRLVQTGYINLYYDTKRTTLDTAESNRPGFRTTTASKPTIIAFLQKAIIEDALLIPSNTIIGELRSYISKENGSMEAITGHYDDCVIALAIALEVLRTHADRLVNDRVSWRQKAQVQIIQEKWI